MSTENLMQMVGGVGIFLFAIKLISESLQALAGSKLRSLIAMLTKTPLLGVVVGTFVTVLLQSSSATAVMTVSFVDAGLMTLKQAIGVIMGANIGTTVTGQIMAFKVKDFAYVFVFVGVLFYLLSKSQDKKNLGIGILAFGLLFIGMQTMESAMAFLRDRKDIFLMFAHNPLLGMLAGAGLTLLVQSSSATIGLTIALGAQGLLPLEAAVPIILGNNIGTTITAILAAIGATRAAKQTSAAHVFFNIFGVCLFLPFLSFYIHFIEQTATSLAHQIANAHTFYNIINTIVFLPFTSIFAKVIIKIIPEKKEEEEVTARYLDLNLIKSSPVLAVTAVKNECNRMAKTNFLMFSDIEKLFFENKSEKLDDIVKAEKKLNTLYREINTYISQLRHSQLSNIDLQTIYSYATYASDLERIGNQASKFVHFYTFRANTQEDFPETLLEELHEIFRASYKSYSMAYSVFVSEEKLLSTKLDAKIKQSLLDNVKELRTKEIQFTTTISEDTNSKLSLEVELAFIEAVRAMERISYRSCRLIHAE